MVLQVDRPLREAHLNPRISRLTVLTLGCIDEYVALLMDRAREKPIISREALSNP